MKRTILTLLFCAGILTASAQIFKETMGTVSAPTKVTDHHAAKGFDNSDKLTFSGSAEVQNTGGATPSNTYTTPWGPASAGTTVRFGDVPGTDMVISGINTSQISSPALAFAILKGVQKSNGTDLAVEYSLDRKKWRPIAFEPLPTGEGTALKWTFRVAVDPLPQAADLSIRLRQTGAACVFRIDDLGIVSKPE